MQTFLIPLVNIPQKFNILLAGKNYTFISKYNSADEGGWVLDISDANTGVSIVTNVPLITGANILDNLDYLGFGGEFVVFTDGNDFAVPTLENLGIESNLFFQVLDG